MYNFIVEQTLQPSHFQQKTEFLIDGFLAKNMITLIYAAGGSGKSWLTMAIAKICDGMALDVIYLDYDNPLPVLHSRGVEDKLIKPCQNLYYVQRSRATMGAYDMLSELCQQSAEGAPLHNTIVILDSLRNVTDIGNDNKAMQAMDLLMDLREAGATVLVLSHSNKDGRNYQGSNNIVNSVDNMYQLNKIDAPEGCINYLLITKKERADIVDSAFSLNTQTLSLMPIDVEEARMSDDEKDFIERVTAALSQKPGLNKTELLEALGTKKDDKTARKKLDQFDGVHWQSEKGRNAYTYRLIEE